MLFQFFRDEKLFGNGKFFLFRITGKADHFHSVLKRLRNGVHHVGRADEQHMGQVVVHFKEVVVERTVLLRIQNLQKGR